MNMQIIAACAQSTLTTIVRRKVRTWRDVQVDSWFTVKFLIPSETLSQPRKGMCRLPICRSTIWKLDDSKNQQKLVSQIIYMLVQLSEWMTGQKTSSPAACTMRGG